MSGITTVLDEQHAEDFTKLDDVLKCNETGRVLLLCSICSTAEKFISLDGLRQHHVSVHTNFNLDLPDKQINEKVASDLSSISADSDEEDLEYSSITESDIKLKIEQTYDDDDGDNNGDIFAISEELSYLEYELLRIVI